MSSVKIPSMLFIADLHIHSRYSRATSPDMSPEGLWRWAQLKGIQVIGTGDFTHPGWLSELKEKLEPQENGLLILKEEFKNISIPEPCRAEVYFMLTGEVSCIYSKGGRLRKIHCVLLCPSFKEVMEINKRLSRIGSLSADGRPILGLDAKELLKMALDISHDILLVPAHAWTPHFSIFGAESGFDSIEECFEELSSNIYAIETGLSSDPPMNWRLSGLDRVTLISNSDAHSPSKIGREANIFETGVSYKEIIEAIKTKKGFKGTIEFFPEEGKYHYDGHRVCKVRLSPKETISHNYLCPVCGKRVTVGVMHRVEKLADRPEGFRPEGAPSYFSIVPLPEVISEVLKVGVNSKRVEEEYLRLLSKFGNEFRILMDLPLDELEKENPLLREAIERMRTGRVNIAPGYDGEYGKVRIFEEPERHEFKGQVSLF